MKAAYDAHTDTLILTVSDGLVAESDEQKPGTIMDFDASRNLLRIEILDASNKVSEARSMQFHVAG